MAKRRRESASQSSSDECSSEYDHGTSSIKQRKIAVHMWDDVLTESVQQLPEGIDGLKKYTIKGYSHGDTKVLQDGRKWKKNCPTSWKGHARMRFSDCRGSQRCTRDRCPFKIQYGVTNTTQFENKRDGRSVCKGCGGEGELVPCSARRYLSYGKNNVTVYHIGEHTCPVTPILKKKDVKTVEQLVRNNPNIKPSEVQSAFVLSAFQQQMDWGAVEKEAASTVNRKWVENIKQKVKKDIEPFGHNFEAVVSFKEYCDKKDLLYVYKINDRRGNPDQPSYVFKTSSRKAKIALDMDMNGDHFMNSEYCFFDGKHNRCRGFITLTASVYHPLLRKQIPLATMEAEKENSANVELFWTLFNEALVKVAQRPVKFNPIGWCTDMAGANIAGISKVYGDPTRIKSCEFHFKDHRNKKAKKLDSGSAVEFKDLCDDLLHSTTTAGYDSAKKRMDDFISAKEERMFLESWVSWWHARRGYIFRAFAPKDAPQMNQAEVIHAGWVHRDRPNLSLLDACQADIRDALLLDVELSSYQSGSALGGTGPSFAERQRSKHLRELQKAKRMGKELFPDENNGLLIDPKSSHCPRATKKRTQQTQQRKLQNINNPSSSVNVSLPNAVNAPLVTNPPNRIQYPSPLFTASTASSSNQIFHTLTGTSSLPPPNVSSSLHHWQVPFQNQQFSTTPSYFDLHGNVSNNPVGSLWHSGMSPNRYEAVLLTSIVKKCYGCGNPFADKYRRSPLNIVIKHMDRRVTGKNDLTGQLIYGNDYSNTYYHLSASHVQKKNPLFTGLVYISPILYQSLDNGQLTQLNSCGLNIVVQ